MVASHRLLALLQVATLAVFLAASQIDVDQKTLEESNDPLPEEEQSQNENNDIINLIDDHPQLLSVWDPVAINHTRRFSSTSVCMCSQATDTHTHTHARICSLTHTRICSHTLTPFFLHSLRVRLDDSGNVYTMKTVALDPPAFGL